MHTKAQEKLLKLAEKIDNDFALPNPNLASLSTQIAYFASLLIKHEPFFTSQDPVQDTKLRKIYREYKAFLREYKEKIKNFKEKEIEIEEELQNEYENTQGNVEDEFMSSNARRVLNFSHMALDSLDSLRKQRNIIVNAREKIKNGLVGLGVSSNVVDAISNRYMTDYYFFISGVCLIVILFFLIKYYFD